MFRYSNKVMELLVLPRKTLQRRHELISNSIRLNLFSFSLEGVWLPGPFITRQTTLGLSDEPRGANSIANGGSAQLTPGLSGIPQGTNHSGKCKLNLGTYRIKIGEEVDRCCSVKRKGKKWFNIQRRLQRRGWWTDQGWESRALACTTCRDKRKGSNQGHRAHETTPRSLLRPKG